MKLEEMRAQDLKRIEILDRQRHNMQIVMREKKEAKDFRIFQSMENNMELERQRRNEYEEKMATQRALQQEEGAKKSFQLMMRRKCIQDEAARKLEERRLGIIESQEETEKRLLEHEQKKERYLDFKRELDSLKERNKEINVCRQRRREDAKREEIADQVMKKDEKIDVLGQERERLW